MLRTSDPRSALQALDGLAIRNANRGDSRESIRDSRESIRRKTYFHNVRAIRAIRLKPAIRYFFSLPKRDSQKRVQFGDPETIRENQVIRANLRIDSRESGHLSCNTGKGSEMWLGRAAKSKHRGRLTRGQQEGDGQNSFAFWRKFKGNTIRGNKTESL